MNANHCTADEYAYFAIGNLEGPESDLLRAHIRANCELCAEELREALEFWFIFAALTERTQTLNSTGPSPMLRDRVIGIAREGAVRRMPRRPVVQAWLRIAAGLLITTGAASLSWTVGRSFIKQDVSAAQARADQQAAIARKLDAENNSLRNLVLAARNAPAVFPGKDSIVSVQDPYLLRNLQSARQTQAEVFTALNEERAKAADLERKLTQTTTLLAGATRDREEADRRYRKAFDAATLEKERGANELSKEIATYNTKVQDLEAQAGRYRTTLDSQTKKIEQHLQMISVLQSRNLTMVQLHGMAADQVASGVAFIGDNARLAFFPANLPAAPAGRTYQLWLIREKGPVSAGTFSGSAKDVPTVQFANKLLLAGVKSIVVTEEPAEGSALPTGHKVLTGSTGKN